MIDKDIKKIYVLGVSCTGKSTLANKISSVRGVQHFDLDDVTWEVKYSKKRSKNERKKELSRVIKGKKSWVIEGALWNVDKGCC